MRDFLDNHLPQQSVIMCTPLQNPDASQIIVSEGADVQESAVSLVSLGWKVLKASFVFSDILKSCRQFTLDALTDLLTPT